ncbi:MAG: hypothetical protein LAT84_08700 [Balneolia bacterium]|nr:hypothetical protein [Balneolia bacterium]
MLLYTIIPAAVSCATGIVALCDMNAEAETMTCCPSQSGAQNDAGLPLITDLAPSSSHCDMPSQDTKQTAPLCSGCDCAISAETSSALYSEAVVALKKNTSGELLAKQFESVYSFSALFSALTVSKSASLSGASFDRAQIDFNTRSTATPLRVKHCTYLI